MKKVLLTDYLESILENGFYLPDYIKLDRIRPPHDDSLTQLDEHELLMCVSKRNAHESHSEEHGRYRKVSYSKDKMALDIFECYYIDNYEIQVLYFDPEFRFDSLDGLLSYGQMAVANSILNDGKRLCDESIMARMVFTDMTYMDFIYIDHEFIFVATKNGKRGGGALHYSPLHEKWWNEHKIKGIFIGEFRKLDL